MEVSVDIAETCADVRERIADSRVTKRVAKVAGTAKTIGAEGTGFVAFQIGRLFKPVSGLAKREWLRYKTAHPDVKED